MKYLILFYFAILTGCNSSNMLDLRRIPEERIYNKSITLVLASIESQPSYYQLKSDSTITSIETKLSKLVGNTIFGQEFGLMYKQGAKIEACDIVRFEVHPIRYFYTRNELETSTSHSAGFLYSDSTNLSYFSMKDHPKHKYIYLLNANSKDLKNLSIAFKKKKLIMFESEFLNLDSDSNDIFFEYNDYVIFNWYVAGKVNFKKLYTEEEFMFLTFEKLEKYKTR